MKTARYLGDTNKNRVRHFHDLENVKPACAIHSLKWANHDTPIATKEAALAAGYTPCLFCMPYEKGAS
jgi:hypothetical protein